jgi:hypothetical protein
VDGWYPEGIDCGWLGSDEPPDVANMAAAAVFKLALRQQRQMNARAY